ncbi:MAG: hypothetical protein KIS88_01790 [Anaerolineales bacterium]|nr:hypothetical protein [Anaerolineales bacterium]
MLRKTLPYLPLALFALAVLARVLPGPRTIDDAFITFRYARNILEGHGFVYNIGQPVLGTTTPLFTLLLVLLALPFGGANADFPQLAVAVSAIADGLTAVLLFTVGRKFGSPAAGFASGLVWAIAPFSVTFAIGGLETSVYVLLLVGTLWAYLHARVPLAAGLAAAAILTRPDAVLLVGPLLVWHALHSQPNFLQAGFWRQNAKAMLIFLLPLLAWAAWAWLYFGSPLAQSVAAKGNAYRPEALGVLSNFVNHFATPFLEHLTFGAAWLRVGLWLYPFLFIAGAWAVLKQHRAAWPFVFFPWLHFIAFSIGNPLIFRWYLTPPLPFYILFIAMGAHTLAIRLTAHFKAAGNRLARAFATLLILLPLLSTLRGWTLQPVQPPTRPAPHMAWIELELLYAQAAEILLPTIHSSAKPVTVAAADVGVLGYQLHDARILDLVGLNSKETLPYYPLDAKYYGDFLYAIPPDLVMHQLPDFVVILEIYGRTGVLLDPRFLATYRLVHSIPTQIYGTDGLVIYERADR